MDCPVLKNDNYVLGVGDYCFFVYDGNGLYGCGRNSDGKIGVGDFYDRRILTRISKDLGNIIRIHCGYHTTYVINSDY
jgi:hypothetical protein